MSKKKKRAQRTMDSDTAAWSSLEQEFFAAAPPDEAQPATEAPSFDDLVADEPGRRETPVAIRRALDEVNRLVAAISTRVDRRIITIALATVMLLVGLSAAVFARH